MTSGLDRLIGVMARLRDPESGCPWDLEQNFSTIAPYTIEETYELVEAIENNDAKAIKEELGDVLFQVVFHAQMANEAGLFDLDSVAETVADKMIERHPHVFGDGAVAVAPLGAEQSPPLKKRDARTSNDVLVNWESDKQAKRQKQADAEGRASSALDGVSTALPAATRAVKLQARAARVGFDWAEARDVLAKIREEIDELEAEMDKSAVAVARSAEQSRPDKNPAVAVARSAEQSRPDKNPAVAVARSAEQSRPNKNLAVAVAGGDLGLDPVERTTEQSRPIKDFLEDELGDVFFALANLARKLDIDPESALRRTNRKFERRFRGIESALAGQGRSLPDASLDEMEQIWNAIKAEEKENASRRSPSEG